MASQSQRVTRNPRLREDQVAAMNARLRLLPEIQRQKERKEGIQMQQGQFGKQFALQKRAQQAQERGAEVTTGLSAAGLGFTAGNTMDKPLSSMKGMGFLGNAGGAGGAGKTGFFSGVTGGDVLGGGLMGFGAGKLLGKKKSKLLRAGVGGAAGGLMSFLGGGLDYGKTGAGAVSGMLGGLFS